MKNILYTLLLPIISLTICGFNINYSNNKCDKNLLTSKLYVACVNIDKFEQYLDFRHLNAINQKDIFIQNDEIVTHKKTIDLDQNKIHFLTLKEITEKKIKGYIRFKKLSVKNDTANVTFYYDVEGVVCEAKFIVANCDWKLISSSVREH